MEIVQEMQEREGDLADMDFGKRDNKRQFECVVNWCLVAVAFTESVVYCC